MPIQTYEIIRTTIREERFTVHATDPGEALKRFEKGERGNRQGDSIRTELASFEKRTVAAAGGSNANR